MPLVYFNSRDPRCKQPFGAVKTGEPVTLRLRLPKSGEYSHPRLLLFEADIWDQPVSVVPMTFQQAEFTCNLFSCTLCLDQPRLYFYCFEADCGTAVKRLARAPDSSGIFVDIAHELWQLTVYEDAFHTPDFIKGGLIYQIFPDRFCNSGSKKEHVPADRRLHTNWYEMPDYLPNEHGKITNSDYFGGDLAGIRAKLDYLEGLGVTCMYLNPIFEAHSNHRYNTADYMKIDPLLGTEDDLRALCQDAKTRGIRIILDGVFSHTGDDSIYFNRYRRYPVEGAYHSTESPFFHWYEFQHWPNDYSSWWGFETLPNVVETSPDFLSFICGPGGVLEHWLSLGVSGFRLDVADELPDGFLDALNRCVKAYNPDAFIIGEVWEDASNKVAYGDRRRYLLGSQLDSVMNYPFRDAILSFVRDGRGYELNNTVLAVLENYPPPVLSVLMNSLSTHDVERAITRLTVEPLGSHDRAWQMAHHFLNESDYRYGCTLFRLASVLQFFLPGVPCIYYGDEIGMTGYRDPFNRCTYPWGREDHSLLRFFQELSAIRQQHREALSAARFVPLSFDNNSYVFARVGEHQSLIVAVNRGGAAIECPLPCNIRVLLGTFQDGMIPALSFFVGMVEA